MPIEINYFAWEQWKETKKDWIRIDDFIKNGLENRVQNGHLVCSILYQEGNHNWCNYELFADAPNTPIRKLLKLTWLSDFDLCWDVADVNEHIAAQFHQWFVDLPEPIPCMMDVFESASGETFIGHDVLLSSHYDDKHYQRRFGYCNYTLKSDDYQHWDKIFSAIINQCEILTGNRSQLYSQVNEAIHTLEKTFHEKGQHSKHQGRWKIPEHYVERRSYDMRLQSKLTSFADVDLRKDWKQQLDFRHYLSNFLLVVSFKHRFIPAKLNFTDIQLIFQKIGETDISSWDDDEQDALIAYFNALRNYILTYYPPLSIDMYTFIHGVQLTGTDVTPYVKHWKQEFDRVEVSRHLAGYVQSLFEQYVQRGEVVFDEVPKILRRWLHDIAEGDYFIKRFMEYDGARPFAPKFAGASDTLKAMIDAGL